MHFSHLIAVTSHIPSYRCSRIQSLSYKSTMGDKMELSGFYGGAAGICSWYHPSTSVCNRFFAATFPFSFFGTSYSNTSLVGSETNDQKMPLVWWIHFRRSSNGNSKTQSQMPAMRKHEKLEMRKTQDSKRNYSTLLMQRLWIPVFQEVILSSLLLSLKAARRLLG